MTPSTRHLCRSLAAWASAVIALSPVAAQDPASRRAQLPPGAVVQPLPRDDGAELRRHLTALAANPRSVDALVGAGRAALDMGDFEAALAFFGRASEVAPSNARAKAGMASALVRTGRGDSALLLFSEAVALGAPEAEIAGDRALALDMVGDTRRAQQEYVRALRHRDDPEIRRHLALSLAISGERDAALRAIDSQLRANDRSAWRTQAFVLALTGDAAGANRTAQRLMLPDDARAMAPFFARLAGLDPAQKAKAVHLGLFPANGRGNGRRAPEADPSAVALAMGRAPSGPSMGRSAPAEAAEPRRRPARPNDPSNLQRYARMAQRQVDLAEADPVTPPPAASRWEGAAPESLDQAGAATVSSAARSPVSSATSAAPSPATTSTPPPAAQPTQSMGRPPGPANREEPVRQALAAANGPVLPNSNSTGSATNGNMAAVSSPPTGLATSAPASQESNFVRSDSGSPFTLLRPADRVGTSGPANPRPVELPPSEAALPPDGGTAQPGFSLTTPANEAQPVPVGPAEEERSLADIARLVRSLPTEPEEAPARRSSRAEAAASTTPTPARRPAARAAETPRHPARIWVQIAGGANRAALPREFARLQALAPQQLGRRAAYTAPLRATNRLLVGPFSSQSEAQTFVNQLAERDVAAFAWTSEAGQEIERLQTGR